MASRGGIFHGISRKPRHLLEIPDLTSACEALQGRTVYSLGNRGNNMNNMGREMI